MKNINTKNIRVDFGTHDGELVTRLPVQYLLYIIANFINDSEHNRYWSKVARSELDRRGTVVPNIEVSGHAIDRASQQLINKWRKTAKNKNEGLHAWLVRMAEKALKYHGKKNEEKMKYKGIIFVFRRDLAIPVLKTVMNAKPGSKAEYKSIPTKQYE